MLIGIIGMGLEGLFCVGVRWRICYCGLLGCVLNLEIEVDSYSLNFYGVVFWSLGEI